MNDVKEHANKTRMRKQSLLKRLSGQIILMRFLLRVRSIENVKVSNNVLRVSESG